MATGGGDGVGGLPCALVMRWWRSAPSRAPTVREMTAHSTPVMAATAAVLRAGVSEINIYTHCSHIPQLNSIVFNEPLPAVLRA